MSWLLDTCVLLRTVDSNSQQQQIALDALDALDAGQEVVCIVPQSLVEFWAVSTRPVDENGLGYSTEDTKIEIDRLRQLFVFKSEDETIFENWEALVSKYNVIGKTTHDARLVAAMQTHGIENLLTFNVADFKRYVGSINVSAPQDLTRF
ncbi:MAG: type II toxin-antitoxin system VapC family toxin [Chloracidobacterium sp.]|nr:type II toxin-antitoxin system VapC family toxin [Chloracidobacterium sp.]MCO5334812.1 type II toxin-antitoxin system VapC family toxin [Pyrinomonadaceae bacterium]